MNVALLVIAILLAINAIALAIIGRRRRPKRTPPVRSDGDESAAEPSDFDRRRFLNRAMLGSLGIFAVAFGTGSIAFLWPEVRRGYGAKIVAGKRERILEDIDRDGKPLYNIEGKFYVVKYEGMSSLYYTELGALAGGLMAVFQKCSHLGCRVPYCRSSGWFECPCHGARFNAAGEVMNGPAPAGLWHFPIEINERDEVVVDTAHRIAQTAMGTDTYGTGPAGDFCVR